MGSKSAAATQGAERGQINGITSIFEFAAFVPGPPSGIMGESGWCASAGIPRSVRTREAHSQAQGPPTRQTGRHFRSCMLTPRRWQTSRLRTRRSSTRRWDVRESARPRQRRTEEADSGDDSDFKPPSPKTTTAQQPRGIRPRRPQPSPKAEPKNRRSPLPGPGPAGAGAAAAPDVAPRRRRRARPRPRPRPSRRSRQKKLEHRSGAAAAASPARASASASRAPRADRLNPSSVELKLKIAAGERINRPNMAMMEQPKSPDLLEGPGMEACRQPT